MQKAIDKMEEIDNHIQGVRNEVEELRKPKRKKKDAKR